MHIDDPLAPARGLINGLTLSVALWYSLWLAIV